MTATATAPIRIDAPRLGYEPALDGVRGMGVMIVMFYHFGGNEWLHGGPIMVDLFFVLSAFLITNLLLDEVNREGGVNLRGFYHRRILRLFPAMYALLAVVAVGSLVGQLLGADLHDIWAEIASIAVYCYNVFLALFGLGSTAEPRILLHLWTLSMEEWFYLFWPLFLLWGIRRRANQPWLLAGAVLFIVFWMSVRIGGGLVPVHWDREFVNGDHVAYPVKVLYRTSVMRPDSLVIGCLAAVIRRALIPLTDVSRRWVSIAGAFGGGMLLAALLLPGRVPGFDPFGSVGYNLAIVSLVGFVLFLHFNPAGVVAGVLSQRFWVYAGKRSYGIYIWHEIPNALVPREPFGLSKVGFVVRCVLLMAMSFGIAELSWRLVEMPFLRRKHARYANVSGR